MFKDVKIKCIVLCDGAASSVFAKTAHGLIRYGKIFDVVGVVDSTCPGRGNHVLSLGLRDVPLFSSLSSAVDFVGVDFSAVVIGNAPSGYGDISLLLKEVVYGLDRGYNVYSGLHIELSKYDEVQEVLKRTTACLYEIRHEWKGRQLKFYDDAKMVVLESGLLQFV